MEPSFPDMVAEGMSLACVMGVAKADESLHAECSRDTCTCFCHDPGGVREPRTPDKPPLRSMSAEMEMSDA